MAQKGLNQEGLPEMMDLTYAKKIVNYIPYSYGVGTRRGLERVAQKLGATGASLYSYYANDYFIVGEGTNIRAYNIVDGTFTDIKIDFTSGQWGGDRYGDYFFVTNNEEKPYRISQSLAYDAQSGNFTAGQVLTGATSGATAIILEDNDSGTTGTLTLGSISGVFQDNETITDTATGSATANGVVGFAITEVANAPVCADINFIGARAVAISLKDNPTAVQISEVDDGSNPPFDAWSTGTDATEGAVVSARNAGTARDCKPLGGYFVVFSDDGYFAFEVKQLDSAGTIKKVEIIQDYTVDYGGARGAITTPKGIFYVNEGGVWQLVQIGQTDVPYSRQQKLVSVLLNDFYFNDVDFTNTDLVHDEAQKLILLTYAQGSSVNNKVLAYKMSEEREALFEIEGWSISRFAKYNNRIYAASSTDGVLYKCFEGYTDDGLEISCEYAQELPLKSLWHSHSLSDFYTKGFLSTGTEIDVYFDIYDVDGAPMLGKKIRRWTPSRNDNTIDEWGRAAWGLSAWGGDFDLSDMIEDWNGCQPRIANAQRITVRFKSGVDQPHIINWFSANVTDGPPIKRRQMTTIL
jgi:hypothetical protein